MPRRKLMEVSPRTGGGGLVTQLVNELRSNHETGQPTIYEQEFAGGKVRVTVIWDAWDKQSLEERTGMILKAYQEAEGPKFSERIALASGLTVPEAEAAGMLRFQIIPAVRQGDAVSLDACRQAMIDLGASMLFDSEHPQLRFATENEAEAARQALIAHLPGSEPVWLITQDVGRVDDWLEH